MGRKFGRGSAPFWGGGWVPIEHKVPWPGAYLHTKWHLDASSRLATIEMGRKLGRGLRPLFGRGAGSLSNTESPGLRPSSMPIGTLIHVAIWPQQIWAENWGLCPFRGGGGGSPSNTVWPGSRPTCMSSFVLICSTVWPQHTNVTDRQDRQTDAQRTDSIGRTFL